MPYVLRLLMLVLYRDGAFRPVPAIPSDGDLRLRGGSRRESMPVELTDRRLISPAESCPVDFSLTLLEEKQADHFHHSLGRLLDSHPLGFQNHLQMRITFE